MSEPPTKRLDRHGERWRTGTTKRYWAEVEAGRFAEARRILDEACALGDDSEAWFERGIIARDDGEMHQARMAFSRANLLGHPVAFCYAAHHGKLSQAIEETGACEGINIDCTWSQTMRHDWARTYLTSAGSSLAWWTWDFIFLDMHRNIGCDMLYLATALSEEDTPHVRFLISEASGNYSEPARRNHRMACFRHAGGSFGYAMNAPHERVSWDERRHFLRIAVDQGCRPALVTHITQLFTHPSEASWKAAAMLVDLLESIEEDLRTRTRLIGVMGQRFIEMDVSMCSWPQATLRESAYFSRFLLKHFVCGDRGTALVPNHRYPDCAVCKEIPEAWITEISMKASAKMDHYARIRRRVRDATVGLMSCLRGRNAWQKSMPRDIARLIGKSVWETRLMAPHLWTAEAMNRGSPEWVPSQHDEREMLYEYYRASDWIVHNHEAPMVDVEFDADYDL